MRAEWTKACRAAGMEVTGDQVRVALGHEGAHRIEVVEEQAVVRLTGVVLKAAGVRERAWVAEAVLDRNRSARLLGYRVDGQGRLVGQALMPAAGLTGEELAFRIKLLAADCNRFEYVLAGRDEE